jgi:hypothetical protein
MSKDSIANGSTPKMEDKPSIEAQIMYMRTDLTRMENGLTLLEDPKDIEAYQKEILMMRSIEENLITLKVSIDANRRGPEGKRNIYECAKGHKTVTVDTAQGVTSFIIGCPTCEANGEQLEAFSAMYRVPQTSVPTHEWYKATEEDLANLKADLHPHQFANLKDHVDQGGLLFRKLREVSNG